MKPLIWVGSSKRDLQGFPEDAKDDMGFALWQVQMGETPPNAKPLKHLGGGVLEILEDYETDTYRAVHTVRFPEAVYVLHCFKKKSKRGVATPGQDVDLIRARLRRAQEGYQKRMGKTT